MASARPASVLPSCLDVTLARPALAMLSLAAGLLGALSVADVALGAMPVSSESQVNTYVTSNQRSPSVAVDADGTSWWCG